MDVGVRRSDADGPCLVIEVRDRGEGVPEDNLDRLFQPFFTTKADGVGLGLANVKKVVEYHGGKVEAYNESGGGAIFRLWIPVDGDSR